MIRSAYVPVVHVLKLVLGFRQDGFQLPVLDRDLGLLIPTVIQVCILGQGDIRRDLLALDFHVTDLGGTDGSIVVRHLYLVPDLVIPRVGAGGDGGGVSTIFSRCKFDFQAVRYRCGVQRARSNQLLLRAVVNRLHGGGGRDDRADLADGQRERITDSRLKVLHFREADNNVIGARVSGQTVRVIGIALLFVGILEEFLQIVYFRFDIDYHRREVACLHRLAVIVHCYWNGFGLGIPRKAGLILMYRVSLDKGPVEGDAGNRHRNFTGVFTGLIVHRIVSILHQFLTGAVGQGNCNVYIFRLDRTVIDQIGQITLVYNDLDPIAAEARSSPVLLEVKRTRFRLCYSAGVAGPCMGGGTVIVRTAFIGMVHALTNGNLPRRRHIFRWDTIALGIEIDAARFQQSVKITVLRPNRGRYAGIAAGGELHVRTGSNVQGIGGACDGYVRIRDAQDTVRLNLHTIAVPGDNMTAVNQVQFTCLSDLYGS